MIRPSTFLATAFLLSGCSTTHQLVKDVEGRAYDSLARAFSEYCERRSNFGVLRAVVDRERLEARREIRQRGTGGPVGPDSSLEGLDEKTAHGSGPIIRIYCAGESVPADVWADFIRETR